MSSKIRQLDMSKYTHDIYKAKVTDDLGKVVTIVITDTRIISEWNNGDRTIVMDYITKKL